MVFAPRILFLVKFFHRPDCGQTKDLRFMPAKPRKIKQLLQNGSDLKQIYAEIRQQQQLLALVRKSLPPGLARHCSGARLRGTVLNLFTDTPVWVSKLRFQAPALLSALRRQQPGIASISVRAEAPQRPITSRRKAPPARHSNQAAATIADSVDSVSDSALRTALQRLARAVGEE